MRWLFYRLAFLFSLLSLFFFTGCKEKKAVKISDLCIQAHAHLLRLLEKAKEEAKDPKEAGRYARYYKKLSDKNGKKASLKACSVSKNQEATRCVLSASVFDKISDCYRKMGKKEPALPPVRTPSSKPASTPASSPS
jgi:hypothetical protein